eukprot:3329263-Ditylum_brightwellii.AAC.1
MSDIISEDSTARILVLLGCTPRKDVSRSVVMPEEDVTLESSSNTNAKQYYIQAPPSKKLHVLMRMTEGLDNTVLFKSIKKFLEDGVLKVMDIGSQSL